MSYYVEYNPKQEKRYPLKRKKNDTFVWRIIAGILLSCALIYCFSTENIRQFLIPGDPDTTVQATSELLESIANGADWNDAFTAFCQTVVTNGAE